MTAAEKIIVALDVPTHKRALELVDQLRDQISFFKVGLQLFTAAGPDLVREVLTTGARVFLDLKLYDIPNTVARAVEAAADLGVHMLTIHLSGGEAMSLAAVAARTTNLSVLGVTVLTSLDQTMIREIGVTSTVEEQVLRLANIGRTAGVQGFVVSPEEIEVIQVEFGEQFQIVVPGIRPSWTDPGDQKRIMTPAEAVEAGADYLVIGRPIIDDKNPGEAARKVIGEIA